MGFDLDRLSDLRVLVVGDVMLDRYWFGEVERISPEAPVPVVSVVRREERAGGAANVACNVVALGARCCLLSVVGDDEAGRELTAILKGAGIDCRLRVDPETATTVKLRIISRNQQLIRIDSETRPGHEILERCADEFGACLDSADVVILSDYGKGGLAHIVELIERARRAALPVMVDPKGRDYTRYRGAALLTPNRREFEDIVGACASERELAEKARTLLRELEIGRILITRSEKGMTLYGADGSVRHSEARAREVYDVTGAGDTVIAVMASLLAAGAAEEEALRIANTAAGIVVGKLGTATASREEIRAALAAQGQA